MAKQKKQRKESERQKKATDELKQDIANFILLHDTDPDVMQPTHLLMQADGHYWYETNCCNPPHEGHNHPHTGVSVSTSPQILALCGTPGFGYSNLYSQIQVTTVDSVTYPDFIGDIFSGSVSSDSAPIFGEGVTEIASVPIKISQTVLSKMYGLDGQGFLLQGLSRTGSGRGSFYIAHYNANWVNTLSAELVYVFGMPGNFALVYLKIAGKTYQVYLLRH